MFFRWTETFSFPGPFVKSSEEKREKKRRRGRRNEERWQKLKKRKRGDKKRAFYRDRARYPSGIGPRYGMPDLCPEAIGGLVSLAFERFIGTAIARQIDRPSFLADSPNRSSNGLEGEKKRASERFSLERTATSKSSKASAHCGDSSTIVVTVSVSSSTLSGCSCKVEGMEIAGLARCYGFSSFTRQMGTIAPFRFEWIIPLDICFHPPSPPPFRVVLRIVDSVIYDLWLDDLSLGSFFLVSADLHDGINFVSSQYSIVVCFRKNIYSFIYACTYHVYF